MTRPPGRGRGEEIIETKVIVNPPQKPAMPPPPDPFAPKEESTKIDMEQVEKDFVDAGEPTGDD